jgi:hypothetical protein
MSDIELTASVQETIKRASALTSGFVHVTQSFVIGYQQITDLIQFSSILRRAVSDILIDACRIVQQPANFQITRIYYSGALPYPKATKRSPKRVSADTSITLSTPALSTRFARKGREPKDSHRSMQEDFSFAKEEPSPQQKEEQPSNTVEEARNTVNRALRQGFEITSTINQRLTEGFTFLPQIISVRQQANRQELTDDASQAEQIMDQNYQPALHPSYKHYHRFKDQPLTTKRSDGEFYHSASEERFPSQHKVTRSDHASVSKTQSYSWKLPEIIASSLPSTLYRALPYSIMTYSNINLDNVRKIHQLSSKIFFDRIASGLEGEDKRQGQTMQKAEQDNYEIPHMSAYYTAMADMSKTIGNVADNYYYSFDYPAIMTKPSSQVFGFTNPLEIIQRSYTISSSYIPDAIRFIPQKITNLKIRSSDESLSSSSFLFSLKGTLGKSNISAMAALANTQKIYRLTESGGGSLLPAAADNLRLQTERKVTMRQDVEADKSMAMFNNNNNSAYQSFLDDIDDKGSDFTISTPQYEDDDKVHYQLKGQNNIEDEELDLRDLKRKIEQILNEELRKYGFQI